MKNYTYTVNNAKSTGRYKISANTKREAIEKAKKQWFPFGGVNTSSFKLERITEKEK